MCQYECLLDSLDTQEAQIWRYKIDIMRKGYQNTKTFLCIKKTLKTKYFIDQSRNKKNIAYIMSQSFTYLCNKEYDSFAYLLFLILM